MSLFEMVALAGLAAILVLTTIIFLRLLKLRTPEELGPRVDAINQRLVDALAVTQTTMTGLRQEIAEGSLALRVEVGGRFDQLGTSLQSSLALLGSQQADRLDGFAVQLTEARTAGDLQGKLFREEVVGSFGKLSDTVVARMSEHSAEQTRRFDSFGTQLTAHRSAAGEDAKALRDEVTVSLRTLGGKIAETVEAAGTRQVESLAAATSAVKQLGEQNERRQEALRQTVESRLDNLRTENTEKLEQMRVTVDEKLQGTLDRRLGESFSRVNENLERVFKSVGEMQALATGVGDLKRVLSNIKSRGTWGEGTLGLLLEQVMTPEQYSQNVEVQPHSGQRVEYAIKLPGNDDIPIWLPMDSKLPLGDYERLVEASERADAAGMEEAARSLERCIIGCAKDICSKYVQPPHTTDFGVMFLPSEGLFAEVVRRPGLVDKLQRECRVIITGPTTLMALLNSLRMGFRSLAIQQRSSEVWQVLGAVKTAFGNFEGVLDSVEKRLSSAQKSVEDARKKSKTVNQKLRKVEALPEAASAEVLALTFDDLIDAEEGEQEAAE